jgi:hypothetical protein
VLRAWRHGFDSRQGPGVFLFANASRLALGPNQIHIEWIPGTLSLRVEQDTSSWHATLLSPGTTLLYYVLHSSGFHKRRHIPSFSGFCRLFFVFERSWLHLSLRMLVILTEVLHGLSSFLYVNAGIEIWNWLLTFPSRAGIAQWYSAGIRAGWSGVRVPLGARNFSPHHRVQTGSGAHTASYPMDTRGSFPGGKAAGAWSWPLTSI